MTPEEIINRVCKTLELDKNKLIAEKRKFCKCCGGSTKTRVHSTQNYADARQIICYLIRFHHKSNYSYRAIAEMLGRTLKNGKGDHAFAIYSEQNCRDLLENRDKAFIEKYLKCTNG